MHISPFKGYIFDSSKIIFDHKFYDAMREDFVSAYNQGKFRLASDLPSYFIIEIKKENTYFTGIVTLTSIQDYLSGKIRAHEQTLIKKEIIHKKLLASRKAMIKPAAVLINENQKLNTTLLNIKNNNKPILSFSFPDVTTWQRLWVVSDKKIIEEISILFKNENKAIIADGHHRFATIAAIHNPLSPAHILTAYFTSDQMNVYSFYRIFRPLKQQSSQLLLNSIQNIAISWEQLKAIPKEIKNSFYLIHKKNIYSFTLKKNKADLWPNTFYDLVTNGIFNIKNESVSKRVQFEETTISENEYTQMVNNHPDDFIFRLPSLNPNEVLQNKNLLPPKSTFFMPRIINGLVVLMM